MLRATASILHTDVSIDVDDDPAMFEELVRFMYAQVIIPVCQLVVCSWTRVRLCVCACFLFWFEHICVPLTRHVRYSGQLVLTTHNVAAIHKMAEKYQIGP